MADQVELTQEVVEVDWEEAQVREITQIVIEVDGENWTFVTGRVLSGQFV